ncbi:ubiquitin carboxyl-terminal hydrolase 45-like [Mizuhopecten yessoensis]|uniref:Ubiquitin carboxyl-terminal hydrolase 16 n=1 Tax=Mizuhopecten yessoensis TaxID=6573 RepID=A0A210Q2M6_MIZYE|nr:ubiquitin carboxyl-terminal hydrolase 45-like [Mizuhopecten yessoensis]OWF43003.1 Ubiquitin carboxyl-terminal hydrolase 16 [Mizuhopecten yessoensis]
MRVLETEATQSYNMGKNRKHKMRKAKEASDSSDDGCASLPVCNHINMAVNLAAMKKGLTKQVYGECASCSKDSSTGRKPGQGETLDQASAPHQEESLIGDQEPTLWVCLQCGHQGCDRNSRDKHGLKHYETPRSSCHCLVINSTTWTCWCYKCDDDIPLERSKRLQECMEFLRKQAGLPQPELVKRVTQEAAAAVDGSEQVVKDTNTRPLTPKTSAPGLCHKIKGLSNLGNTCFFNAVLQNMTQTQCFESCLLERGKKGRSVSISGKSDTDDSSTGEESDGEPPPVKELPHIAVSLGEAGPLTQSLSHFLQEMNNNTSNRTSTVNPNALFSQVCKKAQRFRGYQQQDSHELLRYLLDSMKTEEVKRRQAAILKFFKLSENINPKKVDEETRYRVREYGRQGKHTFVDAVFGGNLISTVICEECSYISQIFEPFLDISLPITEEKPQRPNQVPGGRKKEAADTEVPEDSPAIGVDGFAFKGDKNGKHISKKEKRQAKKDAKRRSKVSKNQVLPMTGGNIPSVEEGDGPGEGAEPETAEGELRKEEEAQKETVDEDGNSSNRDDPSDADVEDNLESDINRFASLSVSFGEKCVAEEDEGAVGGDEDNETFPSGCVVESSMQESGGAGNLSESSGTCKGSQGAESSTGAGSMSGSTSTIKQGQDSAEEELGQDQCRHNNIGDGKELGHNRGSNGHICKEEGNGCGQCDSGVDFNGQASDSNRDISGDGEVKQSASLCNGELVNRTCDNCNVEMVRKSISDTHIMNGHVSNCGMLSKEEPGLCNGTSTDTSVLTDKLDKLQDDHGEETRGTHNTTSRNTCDHHSLPKSRSVECLGSSMEGGRNSPKPSHSAGTLDSVQKKACLCRQASKHSKRKEAKAKSTLTLGHRYQPSSRECSIMSCLHQFTSAELLTGNNRFGCAQCTRIKNKQYPNKEKKDKQYSIASKQYLIFTPPPILTLHLKRFEQVGYSSRKVNRHVDFPFVLDLAPYCSSLCQGIKPGQQKILYALYGVVEHSGRLNAGHYTAYVKVRPNVGLTNTFLLSGFPSRREYIQRYMENLSNSMPLEREEAIDVLEEKLVPPGRWYHISDSRVTEATESTVQRAQAYLLFYERIY